MPCCENQDNPIQPHTSARSTFPSIIPILSLFPLLTHPPSKPFNSLSDSPSLKLTLTFGIPCFQYHYPRLPAQPFVNTMEKPFSKLLSSHI